MAVGFAQIAPAVLGGMDAVGKYITQGIQARHERQRDERQFAHDKAMSEYAYSKDLEQWERANLYNAPVQQMARFREAGLNPRLIYGSKGGGNIAAAQMPKYQAARPDYRYSSPVAQIGGTLESYQNIMRANAEIDLLKAQKKKAEAEADSAETYYGSRAAYTSSRQNLMKYDLEVKYGDPAIMDDPTMGKTWMKGTRGYKEYQNKLENQKLRNEVLSEQIYWMGLNGYGRIAKDALNLLMRGAGKFGKAATIAGKSKTFQKGADYMKNLNSWKRNDVFKNYTSSEF